MDSAAKRREIGGDATGLSGPSLEPMRTEGTGAGPTEPQELGGLGGTPSDEWLLADFVRGRAESLGALANRYEANLLGLARGLLDGDESAARDVVQEAWVRVIRYGKGFDGRSSFRTWIYRIVVNRCLDWRKKRGGVGPRPLAFGTNDGATPAPMQPGTTIDPGLGDAGEEVRRALATLPEGQRLLLLLCYHRGLTHAQAAEVLEVPIGTLKSRLSAALQAMRSAIGTGGER